MRTGSSEDVIVLVGTPNSGKTTLFNWLTGSQYRAVNYPGSTVEAFVGHTQERYGKCLAVVDTPGTYSLFAKSPDEQVTADTLFGNRLQARIRGVVVCVDGTQLERQLYLVQQIKESGYPFIVALTMMDLLEESHWGMQVQHLSQLLNAPVIPIHGLLGGGVLELVQSMRTLLLSPGEVQVRELAHWDLERIDKESKDASRLMGKVIKDAQKPMRARERTLMIDRSLLHPILGPLFFVSVMFALFSAIFWLSTPLMDAVDLGFSTLGEAVHRIFGAGLFADFLADGVIASFGAVFVFVPQIFILFLGLSFLEDSGYLARAATLIDRPLSMVGLSGRSFVPLLSGYACAVPAIMAARSIRSYRERWVAIFIIPLMSCSARLPVYALLLTFLYPSGPAWKPGLALAIIYFGSMGLGALAAASLNRFIKIKKDSLFLLDLPFYRRPKMRVVLRSSLQRTKGYVYRAGPVIFVLALLLWSGTNFPRPMEGATPAEAVSQSVVGKIGQGIEPLFSPMGGDWRVGIGLVSAFAAREVFVSALALVFDVSTKDESTLQSTLIEKMSVAVKPEGGALFTWPSVMALIVFFMVALQCTSTTAIAGKEMGSWKFAIAQVVALNVVAYVLAVSVYQGLSMLGLG